MPRELEAVVNRFLDIEAGENGTSTEEDEDETMCAYSFSLLNKQSTNCKSTLADFFVEDGEDNEEARPRTNPRLAPLRKQSQNGTLDEFFDDILQRRQQSARTRVETDINKSF